MDKAQYQSALLQAIVSMKSWRLTTYVMAGANLLLIVFMFQLDTAEKTIIVPPELDRPFSVQGSTVSPEYIEQMAEYFLAQLLTYNKANARHRFGAMLKYVSPEAYGPLASRFDMEVRRIERSDLSSAFHISRIIIDGNTVIAEGQQTTLIGSRSIGGVQVRAYEISFDYSRGILNVSGFAELDRLPSGKFKKKHSEEQFLVAEPAMEQDLPEGEVE